MRNRKPIYALLLVVMVLGFTAGPALARRAWCVGDPVFDIDGVEIAVVVELAPYEVAAEVTADDPVECELKSIKDSNPMLKAIFGNFHEMAKVKVHGKKDEIHIKVKVPKKAKSFEAMRVSVFCNGVLVAQQETEKHNVKFELPWPMPSAGGEIIGGQTSDFDFVENEAAEM